MNTEDVSLDDLLSNPLIPARDYVSIRPNSPPAPASMVAVEVDQLPLGQNDSNPPGNSANHGAGSSHEEEDFESLGLLTQFIGPPVASTQNQTMGNGTDQNNDGEIDQITAHFKSQYEDLVDSLDRAKGHKTSLGQAKQKGRTPAKLQISIRPMVVNRDNPEFQRNWERAIKQSEGILLDTLTNHLDSFIQSTNEKIRETAKETWLKLRRIDASRAATLLKDALQQSEEGRKAKAEKEKERNPKKKTSKKTRTTDS